MSYIIRCEKKNENQLKLIDRSDDGTSIVRRIVLLMRARSGDNYWQGRVE